MKKAFNQGENISHERAEQQRADHFNQRIEQYGGQAERTERDRLGNPEGHGKYNQPHCVVQRDNGQQQICQRALRLVLIYHHQRGGRRGGCSDGAEGNDHGERELVLSEDQMQPIEGNIDQKGGGQRLYNADDSCLPAGFSQLREPEFISDGKCDEAERHLGDEVQGGNLFHGGEADAGNAQTAETIGADQDAGQQITGDGRQLQRLDNAGHQQAGQQGKADG